MSIFYIILGYVLVLHPCNHTLRITCRISSLTMSCFMSYGMSCFMSSTMSCSLPPPMSPPAIPHSRLSGSYTLDIPYATMAHISTVIVSPCDATCRTHVIQSAYMFSCVMFWYTPFHRVVCFVVENVFNVLHHPRVTCHPTSPCFARAWLCCFHVTCHPPVMSHPCHVTLPKSMCFLHPKMTPFLCRGYTNFVSTTPKIHPKNDPKNTPKMHP